MYQDLISKLFWSTCLDFRWVLSHNNNERHFTLGYKQTKRKTNPVSFHSFCFFGFFGSVHFCDCIFTCPFFFVSFYTSVCLPFCISFLFNYFCFCVFLFYLSWSCFCYVNWRRKSASTRILQTDRQTDRQTKQTDRQTDKTGEIIKRVIGRLCALCLWTSPTASGFF